MEADSRIFPDRLRPGMIARITGGIYLAYVLASVLAGVLGQIGLGDPQQIQDALATSPGSFRWGLVLALLTGLFFVLTAWGLYLLLRRVNEALALLFLLLNAVGVAIQGAAMLFLVSAVLLSDGPGELQAYSGAQVEGLSYLAIGTYKAGWVTAQLFFSAWLFPLGYLVYRSGFLPRFFGVLLALDGIAVVIWFLQVLVFPDYPAIRYPGLAVSFVAEVGLALWLLVMGIGSTERGGGELLSGPRGSTREVLP